MWKFFLKLQTPKELKATLWYLVRRLSLLLLFGRSSLLVWIVTAWLGRQRKNGNGNGGGGQDDERQDIWYRIGEQERIDGCCCEDRSMGFMILWMGVEEEEEDTI